MDNIDYELKLLNLLGLQAIGPYNLNRNKSWKIIDKNNTEVGFIQRKQDTKKNIKKRILTFYTEIETPKISYKNERKINNQDQKKILDNQFQYSLDIKRCNNKRDHIELNMGLFPNLTIWSNQYGFMSFSISNNKFHLYCKSETENFNIEERTNVNLLNDNCKIFGYNLSYKRKNNNNLENIYDLTFNINSYLYGYDYLKFSESNWNNKKRIYTDKKVIPGTITEAIQKQELALESFSYFRYLVNQILPFEQEVVESLLAETEIPDNEIGLFVPDLITKKNKTLKKVN